METELVVKAESMEQTQITSAVIVADALFLLLLIQQRKLCDNNTFLCLGKVRPIQSCLFIKHGGITVHALSFANGFTLFFFIILIILGQLLMMTQEVSQPMMFLSNQLLVIPSPVHHQLIVLFNQLSDIPSYIYLYLLAGRQNYQESQTFIRRKINKMMKMHKKKMIPRIRG